VQYLLGAQPAARIYTSRLPISSCLMLGGVPTPPQALSCLASRHRPLLAQYGSFLSQLLDHLEALSDAQLGCVFGMLVALTQPAAGGRALGSGCTTHHSSCSAVTHNATCDQCMVLGGSCCLSQVHLPAAAAVQAEGRSAAACRTRCSSR
jgi:hypothetical protein